MARRCHIRFFVDGGRKVPTLVCRPRFGIDVQRIKCIPGPVPLLEFALKNAVNVPKAFGDVMNPVRGHICPARKGQ